MPTHQETPLAVEEYRAFVDALPKTELHVHLEGGVQPATLLALAKRHGTDSLPRTLAELETFYRFTDFNHFVQVYYAICDNLRDPEDFALITRELGATLATQNVRYAEVTFTPYQHSRRGIDIAQVFAGLEQGREDALATHGIDLRWCTDVPGEYGPQAADETVRMVLDAREDGRLDGVVSFGLGGPEIGVPREPFADAFATARAAGLHSAPHAGETDGPASIWGAVRALQADRIGHGVRCLEDPELVAHLRDRQIPLEVCPTSNVRLGVVDDLASHPLPQLMDAGLAVTLNSDDPPMFGTTLTDEYLHALGPLGLRPSDLVGLTKAGVHAAFMPEEEKAALIKEIDAVALP